MSDTPQTDERTYPADCLGKTLVVNAEWARVLERENAALERTIENLRARLWGTEFELEKAKAELDWLNTHCMSADPIMGRSTYRWTIEHDEPDIRVAIAKLRKATQA